MAIATELTWGIFSCICYVVYRVVGAALALIQQVTCPSPRGYHDSCRLMRIISRRKLSMIDVTALSDFIGIHETLVHPSYALKRNVSLYCISRDEAIFVETPDTMDIYSSKVSPFQYIGQFLHAIRVIRMPISSFHQLADAIGKPKIPVVYLGNTGRCGSTVLAQALEKVPGMLVHAEPDCLTNLCLLKRDTTREKLFISAMKILCKPIDGTFWICIKTRSCASQHILTIAEKLPEVRILFGYRNSMTTVSSYLGLMISETVPSLTLYVINSDWCSKLAPYFRRKLLVFVYALDRDLPFFRGEDFNAVELITYKWACCMNLAKDVQKQGGDVLPILYEDLVSDARAECKKVFDVLQIGHEYLDTALVAFADDSQGNSPFSRLHTNNFDRRRINDEDRIRADTILLKLGFPRLGHEFRL